MFNATPGFFTFAKETRYPLHRSLGGPLGQLHARISGSQFHFEQNIDRGLRSSGLLRHVKFQTSKGPTALQKEPKLDIVWAVYHLVIYMQSNKIHKVF